MSPPNRRTAVFVAVILLGAVVALTTVSEGAPQDESWISYVRLYADANGDSHFDDVQVRLSPTALAPPAPPLFASEFNAAQAYGFIRAVPGWFGDWHPAPQRQFLFYLGGDSELEVSDGEVRHFRAGDILLVEDTVGTGHVSRVIGNEDAVAVVVQVGG